MAFQDPGIDFQPEQMHDDDAQPPELDMAEVKASFLWTVRVVLMCVAGTLTWLALPLQTAAGQQSFLLWALVYQPVYVAVSCLVGFQLFELLLPTPRRSVQAALAVGAGAAAGGLLVALHELGVDTRLSSLLATGVGAMALFSVEWRLMRGSPLTRDRQVHAFWLMFVFAGLFLLTYLYVQGFTWFFMTYATTESRRFVCVVGFPYSLWPFQLALQGVAKRIDGTALTAGVHMVAVARWILELFSRLFQRHLFLEVTAVSTLLSAVGMRSVLDVVKLRAKMTERFMRFQLFITMTEPPHNDVQLRKALQAHKQRVAMGTFVSALAERVAMFSMLPAVALLQRHNAAAYPLAAGSEAERRRHIEFMVLLLLLGWLSSSVVWYAVWRGYRLESLALGHSRLAAATPLVVLIGVHIAMDVYVAINEREF